MRPLIIRPALNGFTVDVGCQTLVFESAAKMCLEIQRYVTNPLEVEKEYRRNAVNPMPEPLVAGQEAPQPELPPQASVPGGLTAPANRSNG